MEKAPGRPANETAGYLCFHREPEAESEWAALLVVDARGLPVEFLYSGPLKPTPVQAILYQDQLRLQVRLSLVRALLRGLRSRPAFLALQEEDVDRALLAELKAPLYVAGAGGGGWLADPPPAAEAVRRRLEEGAGAAEPFGRARAALAYVVEFETSRSERE